MSGACLGSEDQTWFHMAGKRSKGGGAVQLSAHYLITGMSYLRKEKPSSSDTRFSG